MTLRESGATSISMTAIQSICVYCGSSPGTDPAFVETARRFGQILAENRIGLVYGGGSTGLMGAVARAVADHGGRITGIIPEFLTQKEVAFRGAQEMIVTRDMHERKRVMFERADAFVALPGGIGTLEELIEQLTWAQLGRHRKPVLIANIKGFWDPLCALLEHMRGLDFIHSQSAFNLLIATDVAEVLPLLQAAARPPDAEERKVEAETVERM